MSRAASWIVLLVDPPPAGGEHLLVDALHRLGARAVEREGERVAAWLPAPPDREAFLEEARAVIRSALPNASGGRGAALEWREDDGSGWAALWQAEVTPRRVSQRIAVAPALRGPTVAAAAAAAGGRGDDAPILLRLAPGVAFGTPGHATTRSCLRRLDRELERRPARSILDVGTGSGILAVAAALLGSERVVALDSDAQACLAARENARLNGVEARVEVRRRKAESGTLAPSGPFDGVLANLPPGALLPLLPGIAGALAEEGWAIVSGVPRGERSAAEAAIARAGLRVEEEEVEEGWWSALLLRAPAAP